MKTAFLLFPNNLFRETAPIPKGALVCMVEEFLFFRQYNFHKQKLVFHRASMKAFEAYLATKSINTNYIAANDELSDIRLLVPALKQQGFSKAMMYEPHDEWLEKRARRACKESDIELQMVDSPLFINSSKELYDYQASKGRFFQTDFYIHQRKKRKVLVDSSLNPLHGKWSFDADNRQRYPKNQQPPPIKKDYGCSYHEEAATYVSRHFPNNNGSIHAGYHYPINHGQAADALQDFLHARFYGFGAYEDAIVCHEHHLHHSVLSPLINTGLLLPMQTVNAAIAHAEAYNIPYNSLEGFVRQVIGWREFIRMVYTMQGNKQRTCNHWAFSRKIPSSFYDGTTGIQPVDAAIHKLLKSAYSHHIERLMVLSNFMLLCEFDPNEVYRWFMEMYIDAYDWVMVPNIYGMGQFADGGMMCTKPYISGSNYLFKMGDYKKGEAWAGIWDALFWRFLHVHRSFFLLNARLGMLVRTFDKWDPAKRNAMLQKAEDFLANLNKEK